MTKPHNRPYGTVARRLAGERPGAVLAALEVAAEVDDPEACVVALFCDTGERYLSKLYDGVWMEENGFL